LTPVILKYTQHTRAGAKPSDSTGRAREINKIERKSGRLVIHEVAGRGFPNPK